MRLYETIASALIGTPFQGPAERLRWLKGLPHRWRHPELREIYLERERIDKLLNATITDGMNCIDVGCHLGSVLQKILQLSPSGHHVAVEPVPYKAAWLRSKFPAVDVYQIALGETEGNVEFFYDRGQSALSSLRGDSTHSGIEKFGVRCKRLDDIVQSDRRIGFLKVDVEGGEYAVFLGAERVITESQPLILFESTQSGLASFRCPAFRLHALLTQTLGYQIFLIKDWLSGGAPLSPLDFEASMVFPFKAFNYVAAPCRNTD